MGGVRQLTVSHEAPEVLAGLMRLDWTVRDPVGIPAEQLRAIRDHIDQRVRAVLGDLLAR
jgi:hypothetical protein